MVATYANQEECALIPEKDVPSYLRVFASGVAGCDSMIFHHDATVISASIARLNAVAVAVAVAELPPSWHPGREP